MVLESSFDHINDTGVELTLLNIVFLPKTPGLFLFGSIFIFCIYLNIGEITFI